MFYNIELILNIFFGYPKLPRKLGMDPKSQYESQAYGYSKVRPNIGIPVKIGGQKSMLNMVALVKSNLSQEENPHKGILKNQL